MYTQHLLNINCEYTCYKCINVINVHNLNILSCMYSMQSAYLTEPVVFTVGFIVVCNFLVVLNVVLFMKN